MSISLPVGMVTYGNLKYTKITYSSLHRNSNIDIDLVIVIGKPDDKETLEWAIDNSIPYILHDKNKGFPVSVNDIYDLFWGGKSELPLLIIGNDVVVYPGAVDELYKYFTLTGADWISASELCTPEEYSKNFPAYRKFFTDKFELRDGVDYKDLISSYPSDGGNEVINLTFEKKIGDSHNLCLFSRKLFDTLGYIDVNFFPAYFEDNDYGRRAILSGKLKMVRLEYAHYFHFWSRTIYEENMKVTNDRLFPMNKAYYIWKWGGEPGEETKEGNISIFNRNSEDMIINYWRNQ